MKTKKKLFFTFICVMIFMQMIIMQNISKVVAETTTTTAEINDVQFWSSKGDLSGANLKISLGSYGGLKVEQGARNLKSLTSMGHEVEGNYTKMKAKAIFSVSYNFYSNALPQTTFTSAPTQKQYSQKYATVILCTSPSNTNTYDSPINYYQYYSGFDLSTASLSSAAKGFSGRVPISASIIDLTPSSLNFGTTEFKIQAKSFVAQINKISVESSSAFEITQYTDFFNAEMDKTTNLQTNDMTKSPSNINGGGLDTSSLSGLGLSVKSTTTPTLQFRQAQALTTNQDDILEKGIPVNLIPEVYKVNQQLQLISQDKILIDTVKNLWDVRYGIMPAPEYSSSIATNDNIYRTIGWHTNNFCISTTLLIECDVYSIIEVVGTTSTSTLGTPSISVGNMTWDNTQGGTGGIFSLTADNWTEWLSQYWWVILILIGLGVAIWLTFFSPFAFTIQSKIMNIGSKD